MRTSKMIRIIKILTLRKEKKTAKSKKKIGSPRAKAERKTRKRRLPNEELGYYHEIIL